MTLEEALGIAEVLVVTKRAIHPSKWVDYLINAAEEAAFESMF